MQETGQVIREISAHLQDMERTGDIVGYRKNGLTLGIREQDKADKIMEGTLCAVTVHKGSYSTLSDAYGALTAWIAENGYAGNGAPYDIYVKTGFDNLSPEEWETEVYFPVKKK